MSIEDTARCRLPGCKRLTQRESGDGFSSRYCKQHVEFHRRHGSHWFKSLGAAELQPFRKISKQWLRANPEDFRIRSALRQIKLLLENSGRPENAYSLRYIGPKEKARIAIARLHNGDVAPFSILERIVAVTLCCKAKGIDDRQREYRFVQLAKSVHRLASGTHKTTSGFPLPSKYPRSEGQVLRHLGRSLDDIAAFAIDGRNLPFDHSLTRSHHSHIVGHIP